MARIPESEIQQLKQAFAIFRAGVSPVELARSASILVISLPVSSAITRSRLRPSCPVSLAPTQMSRLRGSKGCVLFMGEGPV